MRRTGQVLLFLFLLLAAKQQLRAQCIDSLAVQYGFYCDPRYEPVCGCDGFTYRNDCFARNTGLRTWNPGICDYIDFDMNPNPVQTYGLVTIDVIVKNPGVIYVEVLDHYGRTFYLNSFNLIDKYRFDIDFQNYPNGMYIIILRSDDGYRAKKIVRPDY